MAWVADACIIKVAQQTCAPMGTLAEEGGDAIVASSTVVTSGARTVVDVLAAVISRPSVDADAVIAAVGVVACSSILASVWHQLALVHILSAVLTCEMRRALAVVGVHSIHAHAPVLAVVTRTVIDVVLTVWPVKSWQAAAVVGGVSLLHTGATVLAG